MSPESQSPPADEGFTLIEMLVVLTIMGILATVTLSNLSARPAFVDRARLRTSLTTAVSQARQQALTSGQVSPIDVSAFATKSVAFSPSPFGAASRPSAYPDGTTTGGTLTLNGAPLFVIDWMTGRIADAPH